MPVSQPTASTLGAASSHNTLGVASRVLGGLFDAPTTYSEFGTLTASLFVPGASVVLGRVTLPSYTLTQGTGLRLGFSGTLLWDNEFGVGEPVTLSLLVTPTATAASQTIALGATTVPGGEGITHVFGGTIEMLALEAPSPDADVGTSILFTGLAPTGTGTARLFLPTSGLGVVGILGLSTAGLAAGTRLEIVATMANTWLAASVRRIRLQRLVTELFGG